MSVLPLAFDANIDKLTVLTTVHVVGVVLWVGTGFALNLLTTMAFRNGDAAYQLNLLKTVEFIGQRILIPLSLIVLLAGIWLTASYYDFSYFWINVGIAGFVVTMLTGALYLGPSSGKVAAMIEDGADQAAVKEKARKVTIVGRLDLLLLILIVCVMVVKPV